MKCRNTVFTVLSLLLMCMLNSHANHQEQKKVFSSYEEMRKYIGELYKEQKYQQVIDILEPALDEYPDHIMANTYNLSLMYMHLGKFEQSAQALLIGLEEGIFFSKYAFTADVWAPLRKSEAFKKFEEQNESKRLEVQNKTDPVIFVVKPEEFSPSQKYPLFIALHGGGGNITEFKNNWASSKLTKDFILVYLQSSQVVAMDGYSWSEDIELSKKEILTAYNEVIKDYPIDKNHVLIGGFSSGAEAALEVVLDNTIPASGFVVLCPPIPNGFSAERIVEAKKRGARGSLLTTEMDPRLPDQKKMAQVFETEDFPLQFIISPDIGHWFPEDIDKKIDSAIEFIQKKEK